MEPNERFGQLADDQTIERTIKALKEHKIEALVVANGAEAKAKVRELIPKGAEVMTMTSETLRTTGIVGELLESGDYSPVRDKLKQLDDATQAMAKQRLGAAHDWVIGSVHAVTEDGSVLVASATGSQLGSYSYGANHVLWIVGTQKIVKNLEEGLKRINEYSLPLEDVRARQAYGRGSGVNKILILNQEIRPGRITLMFVKEKLGF